MTELEALRISQGLIDGMNEAQRERFLLALFANQLMINEPQALQGYVNVIESVA